jgi:hypothetical protein
VIINTAIKQRNSLCLTSKERLLSSDLADPIVQTILMSGLQINYFDCKIMPFLVLTKIEGSV